MKKIFALRIAHMLARALTVFSFFLSSLIAPSQALAYDYQEYCNSDPASNAVHSTVPSAQTDANCATAHVSKLTTDYERTKAIIQFPIAAYLAVAAFVLPLQGSCPFVAGGGVAIGIAADALLGSKTSSVMQELGKHLEGEATAIGGGVSAIGLAKTIGIDTGSKAKSTCLLGAAIIGMEAFNSIKAANVASDAKDAAIKQNIELVESRGSSGFKIGDLPSSNPSSGDLLTTKSAAPAHSGDQNCSKETGKNFTNCVLGGDAPISAAITSNPDTMKRIEKMLGGQSLDKFANGFTGTSKDDLMNYTAKAMGISGDQMKALASTLDASQKVAKDAGLLEKYNPSGYSSSGGAKVASTSDEDSLNKAMAGLLGKLNKGDEEKTLPGEDPLASLSRKLDLLPEGDIVNNPKIDLFKRVEIRYLKTTSKLGLLRGPASFTNKP